MKNVFLKNLILGLTWSLTSGNLAVLSENQNHTINFKNVKQHGQILFYKRLSLLIGDQAFSKADVYQVQNGDTYISSSGGGLMISTDGANFKRITSIPVTNNFINSLIQLPNGDIYASSSQGIFMAQDGLNFKLIFKAAVDHLYQTRNGHIYATSDASTAAAGLYLSQNGINFQQISKTPLWNTFLEAKNGDIYMQNGGLVVSVDGIHFKNVSQYGVTSIYQANNGDIYDVTSFGLFRAIDGFNFQKVLNFNVHCFVQTQAGDFYAGTYSNGLFYSQDGKNWQAVASVGQASSILGISQMPNGDIYVLPKYKGLFLKRDHNQAFSKFASINAAAVIPNPVGGVLVFGDQFQVYNIFNYHLSPSFSKNLVTGLATNKQGFYTTELNPKTQQNAVFYWQ